MADDESGISIVLTPVQLYAWLNGKSISPGELRSNTWHEMPMPPGRSAIDPDMDAVRRYLDALPPSTATAFPDRGTAWRAQSHYSQPNPPDCWNPPPPPPSATSVNRMGAALQIIGGGFETVGGALLILTPEPTMVTKVGGSLLAVHGVDTMQAAVRQLFSGQPVADFTQMGGTWAARKAGASDATAERVGIILDVAVPFAVGAGIVGTERVAAIRAGRVILSEDAVAGKAGRISLDVEEGNKALGKEGGHTLEQHVQDRPFVEGRANKATNPNRVFSRFASRAIAEDAVNDCVKANRTAIQKWALNPGSPAQEFEMEMGKSIGEGYTKASGQWTSFTKVRVVFKMSKTAGKTFYIITSYPI